MNILTCVYCGMKYPEGTPPSVSQILTDHIKVCEKHPMAELTKNYRKLRRAFTELGGLTEEEADDKEVLLKMIQILDRVDDTNAKAAAKAYRVLIETPKI